MVDRKFHYTFHFIMQPEFLKFDVNFWRNSPSKRVHFAKKRKEKNRRENLGYYRTFEYTKLHPR